MAVTDTHVIGDYTAAITIDGSTHYLLIQPGDASTAYRKINRSVFLGVSGQPVDISTSQTLSNKVIGNTNAVTLKDTLFALQDDSDTTKQAVFQLSGITTATTRTFTLPDATTTLVGTGATQTLTNKTLTSPTINGGSIDNATVTVDAVSGHTTANSGTIYGMAITSAKVGTNGVVTASVTDSAITPAKLLTGTGSSWTWQTWSPTITNLTLGDGTLVAKYVQIGKNVFGYLSVTFGSTTSIGGAVSFTPPVTATSRTSQTAIGQVHILDFGTNNYFGPLLQMSTTSFEPRYWSVTGSLLTSGQISTTSAPITWAVSDAFDVTFSYEAA